MPHRRYADNFGESLRSYNASDCGADLNFAIIQSSSSSGVSTNPKTSISSVMQSCSSLNKISSETDTNFSSANSCNCSDCSCKKKKLFQETNNRSFSTILAGNSMDRTNSLFVEDSNVTINNLAKKNVLEESMDLNKRINIFENEADNPKENEDPNQRVITDQDTNYILGRDSLKLLNSSAALENKQNQLNEFVKELETCTDNYFIKSPKSVLKKVSLEFHRTSPERFTEKLRTILEESIVDTNKVNSTGVSLHQLTKEFKKIWRIEDESMPELVTSVFDVTSIRSPTREKAPCTPTFKMTNQGKKVYKKTPVNVFRKKLLESPQEKASLIDSFECLENLLKEHSPLRGKKSMSVGTLYYENFRKSREESEKIKIKIQLQMDLLNETAKPIEEKKKKRQLKKWHSEYNLSRSSNFQVELEKSLKAELREREERCRETARLLSEIEKQADLEKQKYLKEFPEISGIGWLGVSNKQSSSRMRTPSSARGNNKSKLTVLKNTPRRSVSPKPGGIKSRTGTCTPRSQKIVPKKTPQSTKVSVTTPNTKIYGSSTKLGVPSCSKSNGERKCTRKLIEEPKKGVDERTPKKTAKPNVGLTPRSYLTPGKVRISRKEEDQLSKEKTKLQAKYFSSTNKSPTYRRKPISYFTIEEKQGSTPRRLLDNFKSVMSPVAMYIHNASPTLEVATSPKIGDRLLTSSDSKRSKTPTSGKRLPFKLGSASHKAKKYTKATELLQPKVLHKSPLKTETVNKTPKMLGEEKSTEHFLLGNKAKRPSKLFVSPNTQPESLSFK